MKKGIVSIIVSLIIFGPCFQTASQCFANDFLDTSTLADTQWDVYIINVEYIDSGTITFYKEGAASIVWDAPWLSGSSLPYTENASIGSLVFFKMYYDIPEDPYKMYGYGKAMIGKWISMVVFSFNAYNNEKDFEFNFILVGKPIL